jgi:MoaA/NifB/PqqE/SkfB family radical SAM enzyme
LDQADTSCFNRISIQTNGLLLKKFHGEMNSSPITDVAVSVDGLRETNDHIRGIRSYFDLAIEGIKLLQNKNIAISVTLNRASAQELEKLDEVARQVGAHIETNILSRDLSFLKDADFASLWPESGDVPSITEFVRDTLKRPPYEVDYITNYYNQGAIDELPCVLGFTQVFVLSNGDVQTGCYALRPVGNILRERLETILASEAYVKQCAAMVRRECPGCTCGIETSLAMQHAFLRGFFELSHLTRRQDNGTKA